MPNRAEYPYVEEDLLPSGARTANGVGEVFTGYEWASSLRLALDVSAASGTSPTLNVVVEDTIDGGTNWNQVAAFAQKTGASREVVNVNTPFGGRLRVRYTIAGTTPSFTFSVRCASQWPSVS